MNIKPEGVGKRPGFVPGINIIAELVRASMHQNPSQVYTVPEKEPIR